MAAKVIIIERLNYANEKDPIDQPITTLFQRQTIDKKIEKTKRFFEMSNKNKKKKNRNSIVSLLHHRTINMPS